MFWLLQQSLSGLETYFELADRGPAGSLIGNRDALHAPYGEMRSPVIPRLEIDDPTFDLDLFEDGATFVSRRMIDVMGLPASAATLGDVDDACCVPAVRERGYRTMKLLARGDALDHDVSEGEIVEVVGAHGEIACEWMLVAPDPNRPAPKAVWRSGFEAPADLFQVEGTSWQAVTQGLAARIGAARLVGVDLVDPMASVATGDLVRWRP